MLKVGVVGDVSFVPLARELRGRGHSVVFVSEEATVGDFSVLKPVVKRSRFGSVFDYSLAVYQTLKDRGLDLIIFPSNGAAYMCVEAKRAGLAFVDATIVVRVDAQPKAEDKLDSLVALFMSRQSVELCDSRFSELSAPAVAALRFVKERVPVWHTATTASVVALLEAVSTASPVAESAARPLVSVIVTSFNRPELLKQTIQSVQSQTYTNLEVIVVDDGSSDLAMVPMLAGLEQQKVCHSLFLNQWFSFPFLNAFS